MVAMILLGTIAALVALILGLRDLATVSTSRRDVVLAVIGDEEYRGLRRLDRYDRILRTTRLGALLERELLLAGMQRRPIVMLGGGLAVAAAVAVGLWVLLAPLFGVLGLATGFFAVRAYLRRERSRRLEAFVAQMPELARVLANATNAGLSIRTAIGAAAQELDEPAGTELRRVADRMNFGASLEQALVELSGRLPSREVAVLTSTLLVSARSGGSLVGALRDIADTLEARKETRREIRTTLAQSTATGYMVAGMGVLILVMLNGMFDGVVTTMTTHPLGQAALVVSGALFGGGIMAIRRMTRFDL